MLLLLALAGCVDELPQQTSQIDTPRILAVIPTPAEAAPGAAITYTAAVASPDGDIMNAAISWSHCTAPKPPTEDNVVSPVCIDNPDVLLSLGTGPTVTATMPTDACRLFGPDTPPGGFRPRDPDPSGGYYQPVRTELTGAPLSFGLHRIHCNLADAPPDIASAFRDRYPDNTHPTINAFTASTSTPSPTSDITLTVTWPAASAESYVSYDRDAVALLDRRESLSVGWFATAGALAADATGVSADDLATSTSVTFTTPSTPGPVHLWAVLHDDRGGVAVATLLINVEP